MQSKQAATNVDHEWQSALNPHLARRLLRSLTQPGVIAPGLGQGIIARMQHMGASMPLVERAYRYLQGNENPASARVPIVYARVQRRAAISDSIDSTTTPPIIRPIVQPMVQQEVWHPLALEAPDATTGLHAQPHLVYSQELSQEPAELSRQTDAWDDLAHTLSPVGIKQPTADHKPDTQPADASQGDQPIRFTGQHDRTTSTPIIETPAVVPSPSGPAPVIVHRAYSNAATPAMDTQLLGQPEIVSQSPDATSGKIDPSMVGRIVLPPGHRVRHKPTESGSVQSAPCLQLSSTPARARQMPADQQMQGREDSSKMHIPVVYTQAQRTAEALDPLRKLAIPLPVPQIVARHPIITAPQARPLPDHAMVPPEKGTDRPSTALPTHTLEITQLAHGAETMPQISSPVDLAAPLPAPILATSQPTVLRAGEQDQIMPRPFDQAAPPHAHTEPILHTAYTSGTSSAPPATDLIVPAQTGDQTLSSTLVYRAQAQMVAQPLASGQRAPLQSRVPMITAVQVGMRKSADATKVPSIALPTKSLGSLASTTELATLQRSRASLSRAEAPANILPVVSPKNGLPVVAKATLASHIAMEPHPPIAAIRQSLSTSGSATSAARRQIINRATDTTASQPITFGDNAPSPEPPSVTTRTPVPDAGTDINLIAAQVYEILVRRLASERERKGWA